MWHLAKSHALAYEVFAYIYIYIYIDCDRTLLVISSSYKATIINYTHTSIIINQLKKKTLEEYYEIKVDIKCVFLFFLNSKTKYTSQTPIVNHIIYKTYKSTIFDYNIKIVIAFALNIKCKPPFFGCSQLIQVRIRWNNNVRAKQVLLKDWR